MGTQPYAAYAVFCHGEVLKLMCFLRAILGMPLYDLISNIFSPIILKTIFTDHIDNSTQYLSKVVVQE